MVDYLLFVKGIVYLKVDCNLEFPVIGLKLAPDANPESFKHDAENVYEWMYVNIQGLPFALNVSREHGFADVDDELLGIQSEAPQEELQARKTPGPVYIFGWDRATESYVEKIPEWLPQYVANRLVAEVLVYNRRINVDIPDGKTVALVRPQHGNGK